MYSKAVMLFRSEIYRFLMLPRRQSTDSTPWEPKRNLKYMKALKTYKKEFLPEEYNRMVEYHEDNGCETKVFMDTITKQLI